MRAGSYAAFDGVDYPCQQLDGTQVRLFAPKTAPRPTGFEDSGGFRWTRLVDVGDLTGRQLVLCRAVWRRHDVEVERVIGDRALITLRTDSPRADYRPHLQAWYGMWRGTVPVDELEATEEITLDDVPALPPANVPGVRAGLYATVDGVDYPATRFREHVRLVAPRSAPPPPGFTQDDRWCWSREVDAHEVSRLYGVRTVAVWREREVKVEDVLGDSAAIEFWVVDFRPSYRPPLTLEREGRWSGSVPVDSLADVEERVVEVSP